MPDHEIIHLIGYGDSGGGKSTLASTFPKPILVCQFDPVDKGKPYLRLGAPQQAMPWEHGVYQEVLNKKGQVIVRVEYFLDTGIARSVPQPTAYNSFRNRLDELYEECTQYRTIVIDSVTYMELAARMMEKYVLNPRTKEPRQWYAGATETLEAVLMGGMANFPTNIVVLAHIDDQKTDVHGNTIFNPNAPGRLSRRMPSGYGELYRVYAEDDGEGRTRYLLQTKRNDMYNASTQIEAPNPCVAHYRALWGEANGRTGTTEEAN